MSLLYVNMLNKSYGKKKVVQDVSFEIAGGEIFGLLGENGAGKTTTIKMITTLTRPNSGEAFIKDINIFEDKTRAKEYMTVVPQEINLDGEISVYDNLLIYAKLRQLENPKKAVWEILDEYNLTDRAKEKVQVLSGGQKRRVMIARAMLADAELIFMDEPTVGLDPSVRRDIWQIIKSVRNSGKSVLLTTHYTEEAENLCDNIAVMHHGKIVRRGSPEQLLKEAGLFALDIYEDNNIRTRLFNSENELKEYTKKENLTSFKTRKSCLEDIVIESGEAG